MTGRNQPCHCGSGSKYKRCCLPKDKAKIKVAPSQTKDKVKFEKVPEGQVTEAQAKEAVERMKKVLTGESPLSKPKQSFWKKLLNKIIWKIRIKK